MIPAGTQSLPSDALVFFGASGDLAWEQIFPALQALVRRGALDVPVIGIARSRWTLEQLRARSRDSLEHHGGIDRGAFEKLCSLLRYVDGDYAAASTFDAIRHELGGAKRPLHYRTSDAHRVLGVGGYPGRPAVNGVPTRTRRVDGA